MNVAKLKKKLLKEAKTNPKKAGLLGILALVASWFWAPLIGGWLGLSGKGKPIVMADAATPPAAGTAAPVEATPGAPRPPAPTGLDWKELTRLLVVDRRMKTASRNALKRNPFATPEIKRPAPEPEFEIPVVAAPAPTSPESIAPDAAGLKLTSTIVGGKQSVALISGRAYRLGQSIVRDVEGEAVRYVLAEIHPRHVVLVSNDVRHELKAPDSALTAALAADAE